MSMNAVFVQVEDAEITQFEANQDSVEALFATQALPTSGLLNMTAAMQERLRTIGPQTVAASLSHLPESLRQQIEASLGRTAAAMAAGEGGDDIVKLMQKHLARHAEPAGGKREVLSLEKAWHGVLNFSGDLGTFGTGGAAYDLTSELYIDGNALTGAVTTRARTSDNPVPRLSYWVELKKAR